MSVCDISNSLQIEQLTEKSVSSMSISDLFSKRDEQLTLFRKYQYTSMWMCSMIYENNLKILKKEIIKKLHKETGNLLMVCKKIYNECDGNYEEIIKKLNNYEPIRRI